jgi:hypothetical protein
LFVFGGSSAFGYGVSDSETVASFLQEALSKAGLLPAPYIKILEEGKEYLNICFEGEDHG